MLAPAEWPGADYPMNGSSEQLLLSRGRAPVFAHGLEPPTAESGVCAHCNALQSLIGHVDPSLKVEGFLLRRTPERDTLARLHKTGMGGSVDPYSPRLESRRVRQRSAAFFIFRGSGELYRYTSCQYKKNNKIGKISINLEKLACNCIDKYGLIFA